MLSEIGQLAVDVQIKIRARNTAKAARAVEFARYSGETGEYYVRDELFRDGRDPGVDAAMAAVKTAQVQLTRARTKLRAAIDKYQKGGRL